MARLYDQLLVIDLESTCWEGPPPPGQVSEIIEIGLCTVDLKTLERLEKRSFLVRPERSDVSAFCTELTTLTAEQLATGTTLAEALRILKREYQAKDRLWASWGDYDRRQLERCCAEAQVPYPLGPSHLNAKSLFAASLGQPHEVGMAEAVAQLGMTLEGTHHRGHDDAWNIAGVLIRLLAASRAVAP